jgi:hypothetical protein
MIAAARASARRRSGFGDGECLEGGTNGGAGVRAAAPALFGVMDVACEEAGEIFAREPPLGPPSV